MVLATMKFVKRFIVVRLPAIGAAAIVATFFIRANMRPVPRRLGHVLDKWPQGYWVFGVDYGWPLVFRTEGYDSDAFDYFSATVLVENAIVGSALVAGILLIGEIIIKCCRVFLRDESIPPD
jgi:hypothetical protein